MKTYLMLLAALVSLAACHTDEKPVAPPGQCQITPVDTSRQEEACRNLRDEAKSCADKQRADAIKVKMISLDCELFLTR